MEFIDFSSKYRIKPGSKLDLNRLDPNESQLLRDSMKTAGEARLEHLREEMQSLQKLLFAEGKQRILIILQAMDTGGKDGCVKHVFSRVDPQGLHVHSFKKPTEADLAHDFLWRVHPHVPGNGQIVIFNRSHYEDILAVRVKKLLPESVWKKRYRHIVDFEQMLCDEGTTIIKCFLNISKDEQKARLESRLREKTKHWKFHPDDLKDRALWDDFMAVYNDLLPRTSTDDAPWYVIPANRKWYRNLVVASIVVDTLKQLHMRFPEPDWDPKKIRLV